jgi:hypothetical protein
MKKLRRLAFLSMLLVILAGGALLFFRFDPFDWELSLVKKSKVSARESLLKEVRGLYRLNTVELVHKAVFPYDFMPQNPDWWQIFHAAETGKPDPEEQELLEFYRFCRDLGIDLVSRNPGFAVVTLVAKAGFELEGFPLEDNLLWNDSRLVIHLPEPQITEIIVQDPATGRYPYPGLEISPENWKRLTEYITLRIGSFTEEKELIRQARQRGEEFIRRLAEPRGFSSIEFDYSE